MPGARTVFILEHSAHARLQSCLANNEEDKELGLEPCSIWSSCGHAALHYARMTLDLTSMVPRSQISLHIAPGMRSIASDILNGWTAKEQSLQHISSQLQAINAQDEKDALVPDSEVAMQSDSIQWIENAILGALAHLLEPIAASTTQPSHSEKQQAAGGISGALAPQVFQDTHGTSLAIPANHLNPVSKIKGNVVLVLLDGNQDKAADAATRGSDPSSAWVIGTHNIKTTLHSCFDTVYEALRTSKVAHIHVDVIRICTDTKNTQADTLHYSHSKLCSASLFNVIAADETSMTRAISALFLKRHQHVEVMQIKGWPSVDPDRDDDTIELLCKSDHLRFVTKSEEASGDHASSRTLQSYQPQPFILEYGSKANGVYALPTLCAHPVTVSPTKFISSLFAAGSNGACHLLKLPLSEEASYALYNHGGQIYLHCLETAKEDQEFKKTMDGAVIPRESNVNKSAIQLDNFIDTVVKPNTILSDTLSFPDDFNSFTQVHPPTVPLLGPSAASFAGTAHNGSGDGGGGGGGDTEASPSTTSVNMSLVHTTMLMDLETRWLCQWEGGRPYTLTPLQETLLSKVRRVLCAPQVDAEGLSIIESALETFVSDARHTGQSFDAMAGVPVPPLTAQQSSGGGGKGNRRNNNNKAGPTINTAQWLLADLWMIGQRFKDVSKGHGDVAKLLCTKISPKGVDHAIVKQTLIPPQRRRQLAQQQQQQQQQMGQTPPLPGQPPVPPQQQQQQQQGGPRFQQHTSRGGGMAGRGGGRGGGFRGGMQNQGNNTGNNSPSGQSGGSGGGGGGEDGGDDGVINDVMLSLTGKTQPVPYLVTDPPKRETIDEAELEYQVQMGEEGSLLQAYWGGRGAQRNNVVNSHNPHQATTSMATITTPAGAVSMELEGVGSSTGGGGGGLLDSNALSVALLPNMVGRLPPAPPNSLLGQYQQVYQKQQYLLARRQIKRPRLQDFAGRTPVAENGGFNGMI